MVTYVDVAMVICGYSDVRYVDTTMVRYVDTTMVIYVDAAMFIHVYAAIVICCRSNGFILTQ